MNNSQPQIPDPNDHLDFVVMAPPNDNTDGKDPGCECGHSTADHHPSSGPDASQPVWQCLYCGCTRAYPARVPSTH
jgi:hypothetical protein